MLGRIWWLHRPPPSATLPLFKGSVLRPPPLLLRLLRLILLTAPFSAIYWFYLCQHQAWKHEGRYYTPPQTTCQIWQDIFTRIMNKQDLVAFCRCVNSSCCCRVPVCHLGACAHKAFVHSAPVNICGHMQPPSLHLFCAAAPSALSWKSLNFTFSRASFYCHNKDRKAREQISWQTWHVAAL